MALPRRHGFAAVVTSYNRKQLGEIAQASHVYFKGGLAALAGSQLTTSPAVVMRLDVPQGHYVDIGTSIAFLWKDSSTGKFVDPRQPAGDVTCSMDGVGTFTVTGSGHRSVGGYGSTGFSTVQRAEDQGFDLTCWISSPPADSNIVLHSLGNAHIRTTRVNFQP